MCSLGMFPSLSFRRRLERRPGRRAKLGPCSFPGAVSVFSPFHIERFAWKTGKKLPLKGLLCSLLGVGREKVSLRLFKPFLLTLHPEQATAKTHPVDFRALLTCSTKSWLSAFPSFWFSFLPHLPNWPFFLLLHVPLRVGDMI